MPRETFGGVLMGTRRDGASFSKGCSKLSLKESAYFRNISVSAEQMMSIFDKSKAQTPDHFLPSIFSRPN